MLKKSLAIILSTALALGMLVQGSFAFQYPTGLYDAYDVLNDGYFLNNGRLAFIDNFGSALVDQNSNAFICQFHYAYDANHPDGVEILCFSCESGLIALYNRTIYVSEPSVRCCYGTYWTSGYGSPSTVYSSSNSNYSLNGVPFYSTPVQVASRLYNSSDADFYCSNNLYDGQTLYSPANLSLGYFVDSRYMDVYMSGSTYGNVRYLCVEVDDIVLSSSWVSVRFTDMYGPGTYIQDYPFDFFTSNGHSYIKIMPDLISDYEFTVTSVLYSGSTSWGTKEISGLNLTFNEDVLPTPIPSVVPVPDYSYYDTTYINYNGGSTSIIYTPLSTELHIGHTDSDPSVSYFEDYHQTVSQNVSYLVQPFSFSYIVIPAAARMNGQYYDDFLEDAIYQYDVVLDNLAYHNSPNDFDLFYGPGSWSDLTSDLAAALQQGKLDVSSVLDAWYSSHDPLLLQSPFYSNGEAVLVDYIGSCSLILTDSFFFKQTNYLIGDTSDILTELSERIFKVDGFSDSLFQNLSSLYNLNLQYFDSSLDALTGLSYWLNDNDVSNNLFDISNLLSSVDNYLSSVDGKLNYLVTIDSDLNDLLEWFQNQEDSDVTLTLPDFNPSILIEVYGQNIGDLVGFFQEFVNVLPDFDFSDFPNFFNYATDLVDDVAGQDDNVINDLYQPYDYSDSGLHEFGWD